MLVMASAIGIVILACLAQTDGKFTYALDDPYIHLGIAKNFALHGIWGVTQYGNTSASSSPLWTGLLAVFIRVGGDHQLWPLILGVLFSAIAGLFLLDRFVAFGMNPWISLAASSLIFLAGPLHVLPVSGMEHSLQILLDLLFLFWLVDVLDRETSRKDLIIGVLLPALMCLDRYESFFLVMVPVAVCLFKRRWNLAAMLALGPVLGVGGFAAFSHLLGMPSIPNSIMIKGNLPKTGAADFVGNILWRIKALVQSETLTLSDLLILAVFSAWVLRLKAIRSETTAVRTAIWTAVGACVVHASLASFGWFFRYEAYLVVLLATVNVLAWWKMLAFRGAIEERIVSKAIWMSVVFGVCAVMVILSRFMTFLQIHENLIKVVVFFGFAALAALDRGTNSAGRLARTVLIWMMPLSFVLIVQDRHLLALDQAPKACSDIYLQQFQMSRFVRRFYPQGRVAVNDIGAVTYFSHAHLLDLYGLATDEICRQKLKREFGTPSIKRLMDGFKPELIMAYPNWFTGGQKLPPDLIPVATWTIPPITSAGGAVVEFYAYTPPDAVRIARQLHEFQSSLPKRVTVEYLKPGTKV